MGHGVGVTVGVSGYAQRSGKTSGRESLRERRRELNRSEAVLEFLREETLGKGIDGQIDFGREEEPRDLRRTALGGV